MRGLGQEGKNAFRRPGCKRTGVFQVLLSFSPSRELEGRFGQGVEHHVQEFITNLELKSKDIV